MANNRLVIIDGNSLLNRAFYALPPTLKTKDGLVVNAVFGYINMLSKIISDLKPTHIAAAFDAGKKTFRNEKYADYKATRKSMPEELAAQLPVLHGLLRSMNINPLQKEGFEADDVIGTLAKHTDFETYIVTGDKDLLQIVDGTTKVWLTKKGVSEVEEYDLERLKNEGLIPRNIVDLKALMGDASDNIPGVAGVGEKTASALVKEYQTIENLYGRIDEIQGKLKEKLIAGKASAELSKELAEIDVNAPIECLSECYVLKYPFPNAAKEFLLGLGMKTAAAKFDFSEAGYPNGESLDGGGNDGVNHRNGGFIYGENGGTEARNFGGESGGLGDGNGGGKGGIEARNFGGESGDLGERNGFSAGGYSAQKRKPPVKKIHVGGLSEFKKILAENKPFCDTLAFDIGENISVSFGGGNEYILNLSFDLFAADSGISILNAAEAVNECGMDVVVYDWKSLKHTLKNDGAELKNVKFDALLAAYLVDSNQNYGDLPDLLRHYGLPEDGKADGLLELFKIFKGKFNELDLNGLYYEIEFPLIDALFDMENAGFRIDKGILEELSEKYSAEINALAETIYAETGEKFNINSPKQLNVVLYEKLKLPALKKNKSGGYSSSADILAEIADTHPVVPVVLKYRQFAKLQSTYIDGFRGMISPDGRIRTVFKNTLTTTGRLSSAEPNMQNIPVRDSEGREVRKMFIAGEGCTLVSADYSQIELRLMADFSGDENLIEAFLNGLDIHTITAAKIFNTEEKNVTKEMRRAAKAVNFGIIYGISDFGLSTGLKITRKEAHSFIEKYFELYPAVKKYMDGNVAYAREHGYIKTYFGRIRYLPDIRSANHTARTFSERAAMNMPLQGSAADIMKIAMINARGKFIENKLKSKLIMTVHDELVADAYIDETETVKTILKTEMENVVKLKIPLTVEMEEGNNWLH
ncbi:MAG: DNA polymerase I [Clostridiales bacterium]|jgi:DNA polymerase-1|nr:DNA polymerase I [Clostridiales bacterium]